MRSAAALCRHLTTDRRTDGELLAAFITGTSEDAFAELVRRHGPLVWGACRRLLPDPADAEDAFQATFLILVRRARGLTGATALGPWLHQVAALTARGIRRKNARRLAHRAALTDQVRDPARPADADLKADLDAALLALPAHYRDPIILCHLQGFSRREAAERLGCPEGTLSAWLNRGLEKLRHRLRGLNPTQLLTVATGGVPVALTTSTTQAAVATAVAAASVPPAVSLLVKGVIHMFWVKKATAAAFALTAVFALGVGVGLGTRTGYTGAGAQDEAPAPKAKGESPADPEKEIAALEEAIRKKATFHEALAEETRDALKTAERFKAAFDAAKKTPMLDRALRKAGGEYDDALLKYNQLQKVKNEVWVELRDLKAKRDKLKMADPLPPIANPQDIDSDPEVVAQRKKMDRTRTEYEFRFNAADDKNAPSILRLKAAYEEQKRKYEELKRERIDQQLAALKDQIARLTLEKERRLHQANEAAASLAEAESQLAYQNRVAERLAASAERAKMIAGLEAHYLELTVVGKAGEFEFVIREVETSDGGPAGMAAARLLNSSIYGPVTTRDPATLAKLLTRAKNDPTGPQQARVIVRPETSLGAGPAAAVKACDAAGYKTVKFTGYVFGGGEALPLHGNQTGNVPGYKRYDATEVKPADLLKEIEDGMRRF